MSTLEPFELGNIYLKYLTIHTSPQNVQLKAAEVRILETSPLDPLNQRLFWWNHVRSQPIFITKMAITFLIDILVNFLKLFLKDIDHTLLLRPVGGPYNK